MPPTTILPSLLRCVHCPLTPILPPLPYPRSIDMTTHPTRTIRRRTTKEERPSLIPPTNLRRLLQIQHFSQWHPPQRQYILVQIVLLRRRPPLECRLIASHSTEVAVMQPILHFFGLLHANPLRFAGVRLVDATEREGRALFGRAVVVVFRPARADEEDVADLDVAALGGWEDIDALILTAFLEFVERDGVRGGGVVADGLRGGVAAVVEEDGAAGESVGGPVMDAALVVVHNALTMEVGCMAVVVECLRGNVSHVSETIPLRAGLGVHDVDIIVSNGRVKGFDLVLEYLAAESWLQRNIQGEVKAGHLAGPDLGGGSLHTRGCEEVETADVVVGAPDPGCIFRGARNAWEVLAEREGGGVRVEWDGGCCLAHDAVLYLRKAPCCTGQSVRHCGKEEVAISIKRGV